MNQTDFFKKLALLGLTLTFSSLVETVFSSSVLASSFKNFTWQRVGNLNEPREYIFASEWLR
jgi:hypothetical protein